MKQGVRVGDLSTRLTLSTVSLATTLLQEQLLLALSCPTNVAERKEKVDREVGDDEEEISLTPSSFRDMNELMTLIHHVFYSFCYPYE